MVLSLLPRCLCPTSFFPSNLNLWLSRLWCHCRACVLWPMGAPLQTCQANAAWRLMVPHLGPTPTHCPLTSTPRSDKTWGREKVCVDKVVKQNICTLNLLFWREVLKTGGWRNLYSISKEATTYLKTSLRLIHCCQHQSNLQAKQKRQLTSHLCKSSVLVLVFLPDSSHMDMCSTALLSSAVLFSSYRLFSSNQLREMRDSQ